MAKKVIVTGASRGIGFELVQKYAEAGHEVIALSRNSDRLEQLKEACLQLNPKAQTPRGEATPLKMFSFSHEFEKEW